MNRKRFLVGALLVGSLTWLLVAVVLAARAHAAADLSDRRTRIVTMTPAQKDQLLQRQTRFSALPEAEKKRLRELDSALHEDPESAALLAVLGSYHRWLATLNPVVREELRSLPPDERVAKVKALRAEQERKARSPLSPDDQRALLAWLERLVRHRLNDEQRADWDQMDDKQRRWALAQEVRDRFGPHGNKARPREIRPEEIQELTAALSADARRELEARQQPAGRFGLLLQWIAFSLKDEMPRRDPPVSNEELLRFYERDLTEKQRADLERLSPEERLRRLRMMYFRQKYPERPWKEFRPNVLGNPLNEGKERPRPGRGLNGPGAASANPPEGPARPRRNGDRVRRDAEPPPRNGKRPRPNGQQDAAAPAEPPGSRGE